MLKENCIKGVPVKFETKSTGQDIEDLRGIREGIMERVVQAYSTKEYYAVVKVQHGCFNFLPSDLMPSWKEGSNNA